VKRSVREDRYIWRYGACEAHPCFSMENGLQRPVVVKTFNFRSIRQTVNVDRLHALKHLSANRTTSCGLHTYDRIWGGGVGDNAEN